MLANLRRSELYAQANDVCRDYLRQYGQKSIEKRLPKRWISKAHRQIPLITDIVHSKQKSGNERNDNDYHRTLRIVAVVDMHTRAGRGIRSEQERFKTVIYRLERMQLSVGHKIRLYPFQIFLNKLFHREYF